MLGNAPAKKKKQLMIITIAGHQADNCSSLCNSWNLKEDLRIHLTLRKQGFVSNEHE